MRARDHRTWNFCFGCVNGAVRCAQGHRVSADTPTAGRVLLEAVASGLGAAATAHVPDWVDPPSNGPSHRDTGHGLLPIGAVTVGTYHAAQRVPHPLARRFVEGMALGPAGHLAVDATSAKGINILNRTL